MPNPSIVTVPEGAWLKVANNVRVATIHRRIRWSIPQQQNIVYYQTYRMHDDPAPPDPPPYAIDLIWNTKVLIFGNIEYADIYIYCRGGNGEVRVEI